MAEESDGPMIGVGTTTLDMLCYNHPWLKEMIDELYRLRAERIAIQNDSRVLTCVYCGHIYEPGTPTNNHAALSAHVRQCPKHPMKAAFNLLADIKEFLEMPVPNSGSTGYEYERNRYMAQRESLLREIEFQTRPR